MQKPIIKVHFQEILQVLCQYASLLMIVQYYDLGEDYFDKRDLIIDNLKLNELNNLAKNLFDSETFSL